MPVNTCLKGAFVDNAAVDARNRKMMREIWAERAVFRAQWLQNDGKALGPTLPFR